ncbi:MAG: serine hydrolase domain-containing protein [Bacteroidota bacterium]
MLKSFWLSLFLLSSTIIFAQKKIKDDKPDQYDAFIKDWMKKDSVPGVFLLIAKDGKTMKEKGYGYANLEGKTLPALNTIFETGSITQLFTGLAICMLSEQKKLNLDSFISKYIDLTPQGWKYVTVRNLLYHTHGLNPQHYDISLLPGAPGFRYTAKEQFEFHRMQRQYAGAGTACYFTNSAYFLLGLIIQNVSGTTYEDFIQQNIFNKAGMKNSSFIREPLSLPNRAQGYTIEKGKWISWMLEQNLHALDCNSFNGIRSSAEDLLLFDNALRNDLFVTRETYNHMLDPFMMPDGKPAASGRNNWGMGCATRNILGHRCIVNTGTTGTGFFRLPDDGFSVILFTNLGDGDDFLKNKGANIAENGYKLMEELLKDQVQNK